MGRLTAERRVLGELRLSESTILIFKGQSAEAQSSSTANPATGFMVGSCQVEIAVEMNCSPWISRDLC